MAIYYAWHKVALASGDIAFGNNNMVVVTVEGKSMCIGRYKDRLYAFTALCPHAGAALAEGRIDGAGNVVCPLHGYRFSIVNGRNTSGEGYHLKHWPVEARPDGVYVSMEIS